LLLSSRVRKDSGELVPIQAKPPIANTSTSPATIRPGIRNSCKMKRPDGGLTGGSPGGAGVSLLLGTGASGCMGNLVLPLASWHAPGRQQLSVLIARARP